jgi:V-type H+-transporting ATPase subunit H
MSLDPPSYLQSLQNNIRARPIPWDGAVRAGHLTEAQLKRIRLADKVRKEQRRRTVESDLAGFTTLLLGGSDGEEQSVLETAAKRGDVMQYILVFMGDLLDGTAFFIPLHSSPRALLSPILFFSPLSRSPSDIQQSPVFLHFSTESSCRGHR